MLNIESHNNSNSPSDGGIFSSSVERWETDLTPEEISVAQALCKRQLNELDYISINPQPSLIKLLITYLQTPFALWRALDANKEMRGPLLPYVYRRLQALICS